MTLDPRGLVGKVRTRIVFVREARNAVQVLVLRCECGVESRGDADELVRLVQQHAQSVHNMPATREQILERARPA